MQEVLVTTEPPTTFINPPLAVIVTMPRDITLAHEFNCDIIQMFAYSTEEAVAVATEISQKADALVVVIGEPNVDSTRP